MRPIHLRAPRLTALLAMILAAAGAMLIAMITARDLLRGYHIGKGRRIIPDDAVAFWVIQGVMVFMACALVFAACRMAAVYLGKRRFIDNTFRTAPVDRQSGD